MSETKQRWMTIRVRCQERPVPWTEELLGARGGADSPRSLTVCRAGLEVTIAESDVGAAVLRAWPVGEPGDRAKTLAAVDTWLARLSALEDEEIEDLDRDDLETDLGVAVEAHVPFLLREIREAEAALVALGIADDGRPLAERIRAFEADLRAIMGVPTRSILDAARDGEEAWVELGAERDKLQAEVTRLQASEAAERFRAVEVEATDRCARGEHRKAGETMPGSCADCGVDWGDLEAEEDDSAPIVLGGSREATITRLPADVAASILALADPSTRAAFNAGRLPPRIAVLDPAHHALRPAAAKMRESLNGNPDLCLGDAPIQLADLARALRISEEDMRAIEAGERTTDDAGWREMQTMCFLLGSGTPAEELADPIGSGVLDRVLAREEQEPGEKGAPS